MNIAAGLGAFLVGAFLFIVVGILNPSIQFYVGGVFIAFLVFGLLAVFGNAIRETKKLDSEQKKGEGQSPPTTSN
jgi:high-affinity Fe2+/Pb2+ permease